ncbi:MAG: LLM class flavin-dependent oxidoreductase [Dehalococcoidia bacterium]|nr:LLM class flavin-dependent oxidoreductase [Dehalococcoidia bacterium]
MAWANVGVAIHEPTAAAMLTAVRYADSAGVPAVWLTTGAGPDAMIVFAAAAACTTTVRMGTAIIPTFPRHPMVVAQQSADLASLAPQRFTLGLGPSHAPGIEGRYGLAYERPLEHLKEFVTIVTNLLSGQEVDWAGKRFKVKGKINHAADVPVIISALRERSFELAGEIADGAVTWLCPAPYLRDVAMPAMARGGATAGRRTPRLVAHAFLCLTEDPMLLRQAVSQSMGNYPRLTNYQEMFASAGFPEARQGEWTSAMSDAVVLHGDEPAARRKIGEFLEVSGADELILSVLPIGADRTLSTQRTLDFVGSL